MAAPEARPRPHQSIARLLRMLRDRVSVISYLVPHLSQEVLDFCGLKDARTMGPNMCRSGSECLGPDTRRSGSERPEPVSYTDVGAGQAWHVLPLAPKRSRPKLAGSAWNNSKVEKLRW